MNPTNDASINTDDQPSKARDRLAADLQTLSNHVDELLQATSTASGDGIAAAREQLQESVNIAREHINRLQNEALERGREAVHQADSYVHENPWQSIALGMAAGLVLGLTCGGMARNSSRND